MSGLDWLIVLVFLGSLFGLVIYLSSFNRSVADFLAANRSAKRYMLTVSSGAASFGAISILAACEQFTTAGFVPLFWQMVMIPISLVIAASGWVIYRFRETRCLTLAQFFELRYSRNFRVFMGSVAFLSGIINYGIFPAVTARFFLYFCGIPPVLHFGAAAVPAFPALMAVQLGIALFLTLGGGQVAVIVTDFFQGQFINMVLLATVIWLGFHIQWGQVVETLSHRPPGKSLADPFNTGNVKDFNFWYYAIAAFGAFYNTMGWQGSQAFNASAKNAHEARMGRMLGEWRSAVASLLPVALAISALVILSHPAFSFVAGHARDRLAGIENSQVRSQMTAPLVLSCIFPCGLMGLFTAVMYSATISTDNSYLHSWGSIFVQDVILPLLKKPLSPVAHILALRFSIFGVAVFAFLFSLFFHQTDHILLFFAITGSIFLSGAGAVIIGGLYWKRGTAGGAWCSMITGSVLSVSGLVIRQLNPAFPYNGQQIFFFAVASSISIYVIVSLLQKRTFPLESVLHRQKTPRPRIDFTIGDRFILWITIAMAATYLVLFLVMGALHLTSRLSEEAWFSFWHFFVILTAVKAAVATIWFLIGGFADLHSMLASLRVAKRNLTDDGTVVDGHNRGE